MFKRTFLFVLSFLLICSICFAGEEKSKESSYPVNDTAPFINQQYSSTVDEMWDVVFDWDVQSITGDNRCLGCEFDGTYFWVSGAGATGYENNIHLIDANGNYVSTFQSAPPITYWGLRDLCFDGAYMYSGWEQGFECYDAQTHAHVATLTWPAGYVFPRASAYDPEGDNGNGSFYAGNFGSPMYEFDREGNLIRLLTPGPTAVYGMAWDEFDASGPWLYIHDQNGSGTDCYQYDPATGAATGLVVSLDVGGLNPIAGGLAITGEWDPIYSIMIAVGQGTPDHLTGFQMIFIDPLPPQPCQNFSVTHNNAELLASLSWINPNLTVGGEPLTELLGVIVRRNGVEVADLTDVIIGQLYEYDDPVPQPDMYDYSVIPYNSLGQGPPAFASMWIGLCYPGPPLNVEVEPNPYGLLETIVTWDDPTAGGIPGAYWPPGAFDYFNIYRDGVLLAGGITGNEYIDYPAIQGWYTYGLTAVNSSGESDIAEGGIVYCGSPYLYMIPYQWFEIRDIGINTGITGDDQNLGPFDIGFGFPWYSANYDEIRICSNGWLSFTSASTTYNNTFIPDPAPPNDLIAPYWDNLDPSQHGAVYYYQHTADNRFIVEFDSVAQSDQNITGEYFTFQAILYSDGSIRFMYKAIEPGNMSPFPSATVGIENDAGVIGIQTTYNGSGPLEPESHSGILIFPLFCPPPQVNIGLTPAATPIQIPASGGNFEFNVEIWNLENYVLPADAWIMTTLPSGHSYGPLLGPISLNLNPGSSVNRDRIQSVPASAPAGDYTYEAYVGLYPNLIYDEDSFPFEKLPAGEGGSAVQEWFNWGEPFPGEIIADNTPSEYKLLSAYPNPFNSKTVISFELRDAGEVSLIIYDIQGREVQSLVNGHLSSGPHEVVWDAGGLASGVYFVKLETGGLIQTKKMLLLK
ncbi:T9SS type A sorting domain-containing protein [bacterium]|nr:T9SS type A sorting domain-containing protein [FCB group bacterium]MBL7190239.1 T9SS type A sorting domain-containing protein [bacterium]